MFATRQDQKAVAKSLLDAGANLNLQEKVQIVLLYGYSTIQPHFGCSHMQDGKFSAPFIAVQGKHNDMLDLFMTNETLDLNVKDLVSIHNNSKAKTVFSFYANGFHRRETRSWIWLRWKIRRLLS